MNKSVVLIGAGHAHLNILKNVAALQRAGADVTIIAQDDFWYSGMATGMLGGLISPEQDRVDIASLVSGTGVNLCRGTMTGLDLDAREVLIEDGRRIGFDLLSLNLGSLPPPLPGNEQSIYPVKPIRSLVELRRHIEQEWRDQAGREQKVAIVGGGTTGAEIAANLRAFSQMHQRRMAITIYSRSEPLRHLPRSAATAIMRHLNKANVAIQWPANVTSVGDGGLIVNGETFEDCDIIINATGLEPPGIIARLQLPIDGEGGLIVDKFLRSTGDPSIFAVGDCVAFDGHALPRIGVYAVRQAPVLLANLVATLSGTELTPFVPQRQFLSIIGLGRRTALALRGSFWLKGPPALWLKRWIDHRFVDSYRTPG